MDTATNAENLHRLVKQALDSGEAASIEDAEAMFRGYRLAFRIEESGRADHQAALLTGVALARRVFLGGVAVTGDLDVPLAVPMPVGEANEKLEKKSFGRALITEGMLLPNDLKVATVDKASRVATPTHETDGPVLDLCARYYDHDLYLRLEKHCKEAGQTDMKYGYADCALPLILEHNTPNNAIPILWAETEGKFGETMHPLYFRRDRHGCGSDHDETSLNEIPDFQPLICLPKSDIMLPLICKWIQFV